MSAQTFGGFIVEKRKKLRYSARELSSLLGISAVYLCEIEKNRKWHVTDEFLENLIRLLELSDEDAARMYDLAAIAKHTVSADLPQYIMENELVRTALRTAKKSNIPDEKWERFINEIISEE
jgi:transcriptional regulator with XRE-family HTH domain